MSIFDYVPTWGELTPDLYNGRHRDQSDDATSRFDRSESHARLFAGLGHSYDAAHTPSQSEEDGMIL